MRAGLLTIGSELTSGATVNTNASYLARRLAEVGIVCERQVSVGDERASLLPALRELMGRCELLITTGGLGPTFDDVTIAAIAEASLCPLRYHPKVALQIRRFYKQHHRSLQRAALRQAYLPQGALPLPNPIGTAPGMWWAQSSGRVIVALPGVPGEMRAILERSVLPRLRRRFGRAFGVIESRTLRTVGLVELSIEAILRRLRLPRTLQVGLYPSLRMVDVRLTARDSSPQAARRALARAEAMLRRHLGSAVYGTDEETLEGALGALLLAQRKTLAIAESCTGGLVSDRITNVSGSSRYFRGGIIAYHNDLKRDCLGVSESTLERFGAVSAPTARQMAQGVRRLAEADFGLAITGIAGPMGGTAGKPVGLVYLGLADARGNFAQRQQLFGDRSAIKTQAAQAALDWLRLHLLRAPICSV